MLYRLVALVLFVLAGFVVATGRAEEKKAADENRHEGKLVKVDGNKLTMSDKEGKNEHTHTIAADAKITCDGKECKLQDLKPGVSLAVTTKKDDKTTAVLVEAKTK
jgi:hypothetical protein